MPKGFYDLGREPAKLNDVGRSDKVSYPCLYDIGPDEFPPLKDMKLGDTGEAMIRFKIRGSGIEIQSIKWVGTEKDQQESAAEKGGGY